MKTKPLNLRSHYPLFLRFAPILAVFAATILVQSPLAAQSVRLITTVAGNGTQGYNGDNIAATSAELNYPGGVALDSAGNLYIADTFNYRILKVNASTGLISTVAGNGTGGYNGDNIPATTARLKQPSGVALDSADNLYIVDYGNWRIRKVDASTGLISTVAGNGSQGYNGDNIPATSAGLTPNGVALDSAGNLYINEWATPRIRRVDASTGIITTVAGNDTAGYNGDNIAATSAELNYAGGVALDSAGNMYFADNQRIRKVDASTGIISTVAGNGTAGYNGENIPATSAELNYPSGVALDGSDNLFIIVEDYGIRKVNASTGLISTVAGNGTAGYNGDNIAARSAELNGPSGLVADLVGNLYVADQVNQRIRKVLSTTSGDFDGDAKADDAVWRPSNGRWYVIPSSNPSSPIGQQWGMSGDIPVRGDYDGDGKTDFGVWRPSTGQWFIIPSGNPGPPIVYQWGTNGDVPVPGDYDGDGRTDFAVWRPSEGEWFIIPSSKPGSPIAQQWGTNNDLPVPGDYDGDGITDFALWRPSTGQFFVIPSGNPSAPIVEQWGTTGDLPVPGDYDGDGKTDFAVWRPSTGQWFIIPSSNPGSPITQQWGTNGDIPVPADYDGDGITDFAVWRSSTGTLYVIPSSAPGTATVTQWGANGDIPALKPIGW